MNSAPQNAADRDESPSAAVARASDTASMFQLLFERSADAIWLFDPQAGVFVDCNQAAVDLLRAGTKAKLLGARPEDLSPFLQADGTTSREKTVQVIAVVEERGSHRFEWAARRFDGHEFPLEVSLTPICTEGRTLHVVISRDISERRKAERELRELNQSLELRVAERTAALAASEAQFRALFEGSSQGVVLHDEQQILEVNPAAVRIMGCASPEELVGKHPGDTSPEFQPNGESSAALAGRHIQDCMTGGSARFEWMSRTPQGREVSLEVLLTRIQWSGRQVIQAFITDISERKKAEGDLRASEARLRRAEAELHRMLAREVELNQLKSNFVSLVSHEFRTPLGIIQSSAELLREFYQRMPQDEREEQLDSIARNTRRMAGMMEQILILSRLDAGKLDFQPAALDLSAFCRRVCDEVRVATGHRGQIELQTSSAVMPVQADERLLGHIFTNLLTNAVKYSEPQTTVRFAVERDGADARCVIRDHGIGIPADDQPGLFDAFHRGSNVVGRPGTGLGLFLVKRCVDLHGGKVRLKSNAGTGTTVTVTLPVFRTNHEKDFDH